MNAGDVITNLKKYFSGNAWAFLEQVADGTGPRAHRWADAVAMSVWPSRGYDIHGIEVKVSRHDWKMELEQPEKSAAVQQFCNRWWIATPDESIIRAGEIPPTWGWMVADEKRMRVIKEAPALEANPISIQFVASVLRNFQKADESVIERRIQKARHEGYEEGGKYYKDRYSRIAKEVEEFERSSGIKLNEYSSGADLGEAVTTLRNLKYRVQSISEAISACADIQAMLTRVQRLAGIHGASKGALENDNQ